MDYTSFKRMNLLLKFDLVHLYIVAMLGRGYAQNDIAKHLGLSCANIGQRLKKMNQQIGHISDTDYKIYNGPKVRLTGAGAMFAMAALTALEALGIEIAEPKS